MIFEAKRKMEIDIKSIVNMMPFILICILLITFSLLSPSFLKIRNMIENKTLSSHIESKENKTNVDFSDEKSANDEVDVNAKLLMNYV